MRAFFRKPTSEHYFLRGVVCFVAEFGNLQTVQTVLSAVAVFSPLSSFTKLNLLSQKISCLFRYFTILNQLILWD